MNEKTTSDHLDQLLQPPRRRWRRAVGAAGGIAAFTLAGGAAVWALDANDPTIDATVATTTSTASTTSAVTTTSTASQDSGHVHETESDGTSGDAECDIPVESHAGIADHGHTLHDATEGRAVTQADCDGAEAFYDEVSSTALTRYADVDAAIDAGYALGRGASDHNPVKHYLLAGGNDEQLDAEFPEGLVYWEDPDTGESLLIGVVFVELGDDLPQPGGPLTVWHDHHDPESCMEVNPDCDLEAGAANAPRMLHVWFFDGVVDVFAHDFPGAVGERGVGRSGQLPWE